MLEIYDGRDGDGGDTAAACGTMPLADEYDCSNLLSQ
jgi:hypothetical protein